MKSHGSVWLATSLAFLVVVGLLVASASAQAPAPPVIPGPPAGVGGAVPPAPTLWNFLGIPQGMKKIQGSLINRRGNNPKREPKPPLKAIADPANLASPNPAIKKAAEIKTEEDLAPQKLKAIKYLATIGCGCHPGVADALLAALDDCTEAVRFQAAMAFCETAGNPCSVCNKTSCCREDVQKKLKDLAFGKDENGCYKEPSPRVRSVAQNALGACEMVMPPKPEIEPITPEPLEPRPEPRLVPIPTPVPPKPAPPTDSTTANESASRVLTATVPEPGVAPGLVRRLTATRVSATSPTTDTTAGKTEAQAAQIEPVQLTSHAAEPAALPQSPRSALQRIRNNASN